MGDIGKIYKGLQRARLGFSEQENGNHQFFMKMERGGGKREYGTEVP